MKLLALETSTEFCSVALWQDGALSGCCEAVGQTHSERLMPMLDAVLRAAGVKLAQLDGLAFGAGPGSFTGVRIACGVAQGLALGAALPVVGIGTLLALAEASGRAQVIAALDARMGELYLAAYRRGADGWQTVIEPLLCRPEAVPALPGSDWFGAGSGFATHGEALAARYVGQLTGVDESAMPQAAAVVRLALPVFAAGQGVAAAQAQPVYLRDKVALTTRERQAVV